jgi:hypothetical protein
MGSRPEERQQNTSEPISEEEAEKRAREELARITPPNSELLKLAEKYPPPQEWFEGEEEDLF